MPRKNWQGTIHCQRKLVDELIWHFAARYPSIGFGANVNMARQFGTRPFLKKLISAYGLTANHAIAQKLFCHAVGYSGPPPELKPGKYSGAHERCHSVEILNAFPDWPADWAARLAAVTKSRVEYLEETRKSADDVLGTIVFSVIFFVPLLAWLLESLVRPIWEKVFRPVRWLYSNRTGG